MNLGIQHERLMEDASKNTLAKELEQLKQKVAELEMERSAWMETEETLKQAEEKLKEEYLLLRTLIDHLPSSVFVLNKNYQKTVINKAHLMRVADTTGIGDALTEEDLLGKTNYDIYPKIVADEYQEEDRQVIEEGETILNREELSLSSLGEEVWEQISKIPMRNEKNEIIGMVGIALNTTRIKKAEQRLDAIDRLMNFTGEIANVGGWEFEVHSLEGNSTREVALMFDLDPDEVISVEMAMDFFSAESKAILKQSIEKTITEGAPFDHELEFVSKKGIKKWIRTKGLPVYENDKIVKVQGTFQDITDMKK